MSKKYDDFIDALAELCRAHKVSLCLSRNDGECLLVWEDEDGSNPLRFLTVENCILGKKDPL